MKPREFDPNSPKEIDFEEVVHDQPIIYDPNADPIHEPTPSEPDPGREPDPITPPLNPVI